MMAEPNHPLLKELVGETMLGREPAIHKNRASFNNLHLNLHLCLRQQHDEMYLPPALTFRVLLEGCETTKEITIGEASTPPW